MLVNEAIIDTLSDHGIDTLFGIPGKQTLPLNESIGGHDEIEFVVARHETAVSHQAWGYAETSGRMAATCVVPGPGDMNAMNGLKNALNDCTPLLHLAVETEPALRGGDAIHETPPDTYDNVVKENVLVETPESIVAELERAIAIARTPPKGPVRVGIPKNFLKMDVPLAEAGEFSLESMTSPSSESIATAAAMLAAADSPVVVAGGGVRTANASDSLLRVAERVSAPVITTYKGKGVIPEDNPLSPGVLFGGSSSELHSLLADADVVLAVGTDLDAVAMQGFSVDIPGELIHIALHPDDIGVGYHPTVGLVCDAADALTGIEAELPDETSIATDGEERTAAVRRADAERMASLAEADETPLTSVSALRAVRDVLPRETNVSVDAGGFRLWAIACFEAYGPRSYVNPGSWATMGTGLPSAMGAKLANPDEPAVALTGGGGLLMCVHELHTAANEDIPVVVVALNNNDYAIISEEAVRSYDIAEGGYEWTETPIDLCAVAEGMGVETYWAETPPEIREAVESALAAGAPALVEVPTDPREPQASVWMSE